MSRLFIKSLPAIVRYGLGVVLLVAALGITKLIEPWLAGTILPLVLAAVVVCAAVGGLGPGLATTVAGAAAIKFLFLPATESLVDFTPSSILRLLLFLALAAPLVLLAASLKRACRDLDRAMRSRLHMMAVVSHDLRTPLATVHVNAASLAEARTEEDRLCGTRIRRAAKQMGRLIDDLLDFSLVEAAALPIDKRPTRVGLILREAEENAEASIQTKDIKLVVAGGQEATMSCDRRRVVQALGNLIGNAVKFTARGGRIDVLYEDEPEARFGVRDTGCGIPSEQIDHLFHPYWTAPAGGGGTGLGLTIVRGIVVGHGGRIWVESQVGVGSTFWFTLSRKPGRRREKLGTGKARSPVPAA